MTARCPLTYELISIWLLGQISLCGLTLSLLLERFLDSREHIALVVDEYGGTAGVVAMEDVVETVLGLEIVDEADKHRDMQELAREQWLRRAKRLGLVGEDFVEGRTPG